MTAVRPERIDLPKESPHPTPEPVRTLRPGKETTEGAYLLLGGRLRPRLDDLPYRLIDRLPERAGGDLLVPPPPELLELRKEVEVTALVDPPPFLHERLDTREPVGDERDHTLLHRVRKPPERSPPPRARFMPGQEQRLLEDGGGPAEGAEQEKVQGVLHTVEAEPEPIDDHQEPPGRDRRRGELAEEEREAAGVTAPEALPTHSPQRSESAQTHPILEPAESVLRMNAQPLATTPFLSDAPRPPAADALSAASAKMNDPCPTARRFRVYSVHTREV